MRSLRLLAIVCFVWVAAGPGAALSGEVTERLVAEARVALEEGNHSEAVRRLEGAVEADPDSAVAWALLGRAQVLERRYRRGEEALRRARELGADDLATLLYLGSTLWENGAGDEAEEVYRQALAGHGPRPPLLHQLGRLLIWRGRFAEAVEPLATAVRTAPGTAEVHADLARAYAGSNAVDAALVEWRRAVELAPEHSGYRYGLARALGVRGEAAAAAAELEIYRRLYAADQERTLSEGLARARIDRGWELLRQGRAAAAAEHLRSLPASPEALVALASACSALGDSAAALEALERAVGLAPQRQDLRLLLSEARLGAGGE